MENQKNEQVKIIQDPIRKIVLAQIDVLADCEDSIGAANAMAHLLSQVKPLQVVLPAGTRLMKMSDDEIIVID